MITISLSSEEVEKKILALLLIKPTYVRAANMDLNLFAYKSHRVLADLIKKYVVKYKSPPTLDSLKLFVDEKVTEDNLKDLSAAVTLAKDLPAAVPEESGFYFEKAENLKIGRSLFDIGQEIKDGFSRNITDFRSFKKDILNKILYMSSDSDNIRRGFLNAKDNLSRRWTNYRNTEDGNEESDIIPFGITALDDFFGGMRKTFTSLIYSRTGGGKTRTAINIAYNNGIRGKRVMYVSLEMSFDLIASCFDSRHAFLDSHDIIFGKLTKEDRKKYKEMLKKQVNEKCGVWLVDIPAGATSMHVMQEIEIYTAIHGIPPELVIVDYAHLIEPLAKYRAGDRSTKFDNLFKEFHEIARAYNVALLTAAQESREASKADAKKKKNDDEDDDEDGVHKISASAFMAIHCETVMRLKQDKFDRYNNRLWVISDKNRYGKTAERIPLLCSWPLSYVGSKNDKLPTGIKIIKTKR